MNPPASASSRLEREVARHSPLAPRLRRDLTDLNAQYLQLGLTPSLAEDARFAWTEPVRRALRESGPETLSRLADVPLALFEIAFGKVAGAAGVAGVADAREAAIAGELLSCCESFAQQAVYFALRLVEADSLAAGFVLELSGATRRWLADCRPSELAGLARQPGLIRPRWRLHAGLWHTLIGAARRDSPTALQWGCCIGVCLTGAGDRETPPAPARRLPRS